MWCEGGEKTFIQNMIQQSKQFGQQCCWFTTLVSKQSHLKHVYDELNKVDVAEYKTISMGQGNKTSRIVVWTFLSVEDEKQWAISRF